MTLSNSTAHTIGAGRSCGGLPGMISDIRSGLSRLGEVRDRSGGIRLQVSGGPDARTAPADQASPSIAGVTKPPCASGA
jgi:hypothetical protein